MKKNSLLFLFTFAIISVNGFSQNKQSILWEIKGKDLRSPSYLFGSIHVADKRVFDFPDSVIAKLKECEIIAFELNFDSISGEILDDAKKQKNKLIKDILSPDEIEKVKLKLKEKGVEADGLENKTVGEIYAKFQEETIERPKNAVFLDAYLFNIAKQFQKEVIGIEKYSDQANLLNELKENAQKKFLLSIADDSFLDETSILDSLMEYYLQEDIDEIYNVIHQQARDIEDVVFVQRNKVMARCIDSLMHLKSTFVCVGAGHLGGSEGLIALLQKQGYSVSPIISPRTGLHKELINNAPPKQWVDVLDIVNGYTVQMPGTPQPMNMNGAEMKGYMDFTTGHFFIASAGPIAGKSQKAQNKALKEALKKLSQKAKIISKKTVIYKNMHGYDVQTKIKDAGFYSVRILVDSSTLYLLMVGLTSEHPDEKIVAKFYTSLANTKRNYQDRTLFTNKECAFQIMAPPGFKLTDQAKGREANRKEFSCLDFSLKGSVNVACLDYEPGTYSANTQDFFDQSFSPLKSFFKTKPELIKDTLFRGYPSRDYKLNSNNGTIMYIRYVLKCSRVYIVIVTTTVKTKQEEMMNVLRSFDFIDSSPIIYNDYTSPQKSFKLSAPGEVSQQIDTTFNGSYAPIDEYYATNSSSNQWLKIVKHQFSEYDYCENDSAFLAYFEPHAVIYFQGDSLCEKQVHQRKDSSSYYEYRVCFKNNTSIEKKVNVYVNGRDYYLITTLDDKINPSNNITNNVLSSFSILPSDNSFDVFASKKQKMFEALSSTDSSAQEEALNVFTYYELEKTDTTQLKKLLQQPFIDDKPTDYSTRIAVYLQLYNLFTDDQKIKYIKANYSTMPDSGSVKIVALYTLSSILSTEALQLWKRLILLERPVLLDDYDLYSCLGTVETDSLELLAALYPDLILMAENNDYKKLYYHITTNVLHENLISVDNIMHLQNETLLDVQNEYERIKNAENDGYSYRFSEMLYVLNRLPYTKESLQLNKSVLADSLIYSKKEAIAFFLKNNMKPDKKAYKSFVENPINVNDLFIELQKDNHLEVFPAALKKQKKLAEGDMLQYANYDDIWLNKLKLIKEIKQVYEGKQQRFFVYRLYYDDENYYLGIAGPYPANDKVLVASGTRTGIVYSGFDEKNIDIELHKYLNKTTTILEH